MSYNSTNMKHYTGIGCSYFSFNVDTYKNGAFHVINCSRVRRTSAPAKTWICKSSLCDTHFSYFSPLEERGISILHQVWS